MTTDEILDGLPRNGWRRRSTCSATSCAACAPAGRRRRCSTPARRVLRLADAAQAARADQHARTAADRHPAVRRRRPQGDREGDPLERPGHGAEQRRQGDPPEVPAMCGEQRTEDGRSRSRSRPRTPRSRAATSAATPTSTSTTREKAKTMTEDDARQGQGEGAGRCSRSTRTRSTRWRTRRRRKSWSSNGSCRFAVSDRRPRDRRTERAADCNRPSAAQRLTRFHRARSMRTLRELDEPVPRRPRRAG